MKSPKITVNLIVVAYCRVATNFFPTMPGSLICLPFDQVSLGIEKNMVVET